MQSVRALRPAATQCARALTASRRSLALTTTHRAASSLLPLQPFLIERYAGWFDGSDSLSSSEVEPLSLNQLLLHADADGLRRYETLSLGYPDPSEGSRYLRDAIAGQYATVSADQVNVCAPQEGILLAMTAMLQPGDAVIATVPCRTEGCRSLRQLRRRVCLCARHLTGGAGEAALTLEYLDEAAGLAILVADEQGHVHRVIEGDGDAAEGRLRARAAAYPLGEAVGEEEARVEAEEHLEGDQLVRSARAAPRVHDHRHRQRAAARLELQAVVGAQVDGAVRHREVGGGGGGRQHGGQARGGGAQAHAALVVVEERERACAIDRHRGGRV